MSKIYTRTGDDGTTGLGDGRRVAKDDPRVEAYGCVDEANSAVGVVLAVPGLPRDVAAALTACSTSCSTSAASCAFPGIARSTAARTSALEQTLDGFNERLPPLKEFILPGGGPAAAACHLARTVCRRAERRAWTLARAEDGCGRGPQYLNRLSDLLFVLARVLARHESGSEVLWKHERRGGAPATRTPRLRARLVESRADVGGTVRDARARPRQQVARGRGTRCRAQPPQDPRTAPSTAPDRRRRSRRSPRARAPAPTRGPPAAPARVASANTLSPPQSPRISVIRCGPPTV